MKQITLFSALLFCCAALFAQETTPSITVHRLTTPLRLDGVLDEAVWQTPEPANHFRRNFPVDTGYARSFTEVRMAFDDKNLYVAATCWQAKESYTVQSLKRDFGPGTSDVLNILLDPFKDGLNGFVFGVNPLNVQREALIDNGNNSSYDWDNRWRSAVQNTPEYWTVEVAIPFKTLRYKVSEGANTWRVNFIRTRLSPWEVSAWHPVPQQFSPNNLAFTNTMAWEGAPPKPAVNVSLIPYSIGRYGIDYKRDPKTLEVVDKPVSWSGNIGGDAKIGLTPSLNLDLTYNPDFSQVEVDRQVANLSRFELFFPERRQFFLENRDLFAMFGFPNTRPFFSRRIGLAYNPVSGRNETTPILAGARLSGKLTDKLRIGALNMQTKRVDWSEDRALPAANFTVVTAQRKMFARSALSAIFVNKHNFLQETDKEPQQGYQPWNRVAGLEYNLYSPDNRWEGEWYYHRSFSPDPKQRGATFAQFVGYNGRRFNSRLGYTRIDSSYSAEAGFVPRPGIQNFYPGASFIFYPQRKYFNTWSVGMEGDLTFDLKMKETDRELFFFWGFDMKNLTMFKIGIWNNYTYLFAPFDPTNLYKEGAQPLPGDRGYAYSGIGGEITSSSSYNLQGTVEWGAGQFFNGSIARVEGESSYRLQPYGKIGVGFSYNRIRLPDPYASADLWLVGPRAELSFSRSLFLSAFFQYNTQANNFNVNARMQWRFAPVSDLFLVYTDNSYAESLPNTPIRVFAPKNKAMVLKVVYWLNV